MKIRCWQILMIFYSINISIESRNHQLMSSDSLQLILDKVFLAKNMTPIVLPKFEISDDDSSCVFSLVDVVKTAFNFLTKCSFSPSSSMKSTPQCAQPNWALKMIDGLPTKPSGITRRGPFFFIGDYEVCKSVWKDDRKPAHYCRINAKVGIGGEKRFESPVTIGICLPLSCGHHQIESLNTMIRESKILHDKLVIDNIHCDDARSDAMLSPRRVLVAIVAMFFVIIIVVGTLMEKLKEKGVIELKHRQGLLINDDRSECGEDSMISSIGNAPSLALTYKSSPSNIFRQSIYSIFIDVVTSFSIRCSYKHLCRNSARELPLINGIRVVAAFWVIFSHTCLFSIQYSDTIREMMTMNHDDSSATTTTATNFVINSSLAVDTFLFVSALVATFSIRKRMIYKGADKRFSCKTMFTIFFHRILRLFPSLFFYLGFITFVYNHLSDGPFWNSNGMFGFECNSTNIWPHFLLVSNIFPSTCAPWLWYISLDFQLYLLIPLCVFLLAKHRFGWIGIVCLLMLSLLYRFVASIMWTLPPNIFVEMLSGKLEKVHLTYRLLYASPFSRCPPFLIGILTGWYICNKSSIDGIKSRKLSIIAHLLVILLLAFPLFGPLTRWKIGIYAHSIAHRTIWSIGLAIMILLFQKGSRGVWRHLASRNFVVLSRLSFGVFLSHEPILLFYLNTLRQPMSPTSFFDFSFLIVSIYVFSVISALGIALTIEIPLLTIERKLLMRARQRFSSKSVSFCDDTEIMNSDDDDDDDDDSGDDDDDEEDCDNGDIKIEKRSNKKRDGGNILDDEMRFDEKTKIWLQRNPKLFVDTLNETSSSSLPDDSKEVSEEKVASPLEIIKNKLEKMSATSC